MTPIDKPLKVCKYSSKTQATLNNRFRQWEGSESEVICGSNTFEYGVITLKHTKECKITKLIVRMWLGALSITTMGENLGENSLSAVVVFAAFQARLLSRYTLVRCLPHLETWIRTNSVNSGIGHDCSSMTPPNPQLPSKSPSF